jgi:pimeloyl-ACP methyl ester carboxylesterase
MKTVTKFLLSIGACLALHPAGAQAPAWVKPEWQKSAIDRVNAIPNVDARLSALEKALDTAKNKSSLSATTARYTLEVLRDVKAHPDAYAHKMSPPPPPGVHPPAPASPPTHLSDYVSSAVPFALDLTAELARAEKIASAIQAGKDPMAGIKGDVHLAYRSSLDGMLMPFRVYIPSGYSPERAWPLVVFLHGGGGDENNYTAQNVLQPAADRLGYLVVSPNGRGPDSSYLKENGGEQDVMDVVALMQKYYKINPKRIYLAGHSMGGFGTWTVGLHHRDVFAALASEAGTPPPTDFAALITSGEKIPVLATVGGKDANVPPGPAIEAWYKVKAAGYPTKLVEYPDATHNDVYSASAPEVFAWFDQYSK